MPRLPFSFAKDPREDLVVSWRWAARRGAKGVKKLAGRRPEVDATWPSRRGLMPEANKRVSSWIDLRIGAPVQEGELPGIGEIVEPEDHAVRFQVDNA